MSNWTRVTRHITYIDVVGAIVVIALAVAIFLGVPHV